MPSRARILQSMASIARHTAPLLVTLILDGSLLVYLMLALFDLGLGYSNHQLRKHWPGLTDHALLAAETATERLFARLQLPLMFVFGGFAFIGTVALALLPFVMAMDLGVSAWAELKADGGRLAAIAAVMAILASYSMHADMRSLGERWKLALPAAEKAADRTLMQLAMFMMIAIYALAIGGRGIGLWLLAAAFAAVQVWFDLRVPVPQTLAGAHASLPSPAATSPPRARRRKR